MFEPVQPLSKVITGGATLRDFVNSAGDRGYFTPRLQVYDRAGLPCPRCSRPLRRTLSGQRSTFYCGGGGGNGWHGGGLTGGGGGGKVRVKRRTKQ